MPFLTSIAGSGTGQYFADESGNPYLIHWDSVWGIITQAGSAGGAVTWQSDMDNYCSARAAEGFNGFLTTPVSTTQNTGANLDGSTWDGVEPFTSPGVPNGTFWARVDYLLASAAASNGLTVLLDTMYTYAINTTGGPLNGWTNTQFGNYGTAIGARYAATPNLIWHFGDDNLGSGNDAQFSAFLTGIRGSGANQLCSIENAANSTSRQAVDGSETFPWGTANAQYNYCYNYNASYDAVEVAYLESSPLCVCQMDGLYDNEPSGVIGETEELFWRKLLWWALSSGSRGYQYGNNDLWYWPANAISSGLVSASPGSSYMQPAALNTIMTTFASLRGWHQLVPDTSSGLVTAGRGTHVTHFAPGGGTGSYSGGNTYVTASKTADGTLAVIYIPSNVTITVNGALMNAGYGAKWIDPASGAATTATIASTYNNPSANSAGDPDWVLVLSVPPYATWTVP